MVLAELNRRFADSPDERKLSLAYALAHYGDVQVDFLISQIKTASREEVDNLVTALGYEQEAAIAALKTAAAQNESDLAYKGRLAVVACTWAKQRSPVRCCSCGLIRSSARF
jgi:hypothetical protein